MTPASTPLAAPSTLALLALTFLLGAVPFSYLIARLRGVDLRRIGSGNIGATNLTRVAGAGLGAAGLLLDALKGTAAVALARAAGDGTLVPALAGFLAVLGHNFTPFLGFRGGKGVATGAGAFLPIAPGATAAGLLVFAVTLAVTRYVSAGSIAGSLALAVAAFVTGQPPGVAWAAAAVALLVAWTHRGNLARIAGGTESRLGRPGRERPAG